MNKEQREEAIQTRVKAIKEMAEEIEKIQAEAQLTEPGKPLEEWSRTDGGSKFSFKISGRTIDFYTNKYCSFEIADAEEVHRNLGRVIHTAKMKQGK